MTLTNWQKASVNETANGLLEYEAQQLCLGESIDIDTCKKWISANKYPFGLRENHPYQVWRQEIKLVGEFFLLVLLLSIIKYGGSLTKSLEKSIVTTNEKN